MHISHTYILLSEITGGKQVVHSLEKLSIYLHCEELRYEHVKHKQINSASARNTEHPLTSPAGVSG